MNIESIESNNPLKAIDSVNKTGSFQKTEENFKNILQKAYEQKDKDQLKKVCQQFEQFFLDMLYKQMKAAVPKSDFIDRSFSGEVFESMMDEQLMEEAAAVGGTGIGDTLYKQLSKQMDDLYINNPEGK